MNPLMTRQAIHGQNITLARFELLKGAVVPEHSHVNEQIMTFEKGRARFVVGGREVTIAAGESLRIPPNVPHSGEVLEDSIVVDVFSPPRRIGYAARTRI
ncbi:MAG: cupin domain-containing protein [Bryobacteraceae bacterium]